VNVKARISLTYMEQTVLLGELNQLYGYEDGQVPMTAQPTTEHIEATHRLLREVNQTFGVDVSVGSDGRLIVQSLLPIA